jgi:hypothetical protein
MIAFFICVAAAHYVFVKYEPSPWEAQWAHEISNWRDKECEILNQPFHRDRALWSVYNSQVRNLMSRKNEKPSATFDELDVYSRFIWGNEENGSVIEQLIEPLVGILRDPLTICAQLRPVVGVFAPGEGVIQAKRYLLPEIAPGGEPVRYMLMDLGASVYSGWASDSDAIGAKWFVEHYAKHHIYFDRIVSFEATHQTPDQIFGTVPAELLGRYTYINMPVSSSQTSAFNPWNVLVQTFTKQDYVIVKLDIDAPEIERQLVVQLISNKTIRELVDEFYFEHHVNSAAMNPYWGTENSEHTMVQSYALFKNLRMHGIRAHSWP